MPEMRRRETSVVFQTATLFPWRTVRANVLFPIEIFNGDRQAAGAEALKLLDITGLTGFADRLPEQLSGGMAQRVSLCRALITNPELLLMDEPFGALDVLTRDDLSLELQRVWERYRKTVLFVTHSICEAVFLSDRVIVFSPRPAVIARDLAIDASAAIPRHAGDGGVQPILRGSPRQSGPLMPVSAVERAICVAAQSAVLWRIYRGILIPVTVFLALALGWALAVKVTGIPPILLPRPVAAHAWLTFSQTVLGFLISVTIGITGWAISKSRFMFEAFYPVIVALQVMPKEALAPLLVLWFGAGTLSRTVLAFPIAFFPMVINTILGVRGLNGKSAAPVVLLDELHSAVRYAPYWTPRHRVRQSHLWYHSSQATQDRCPRARQRPPHQSGDGSGCPAAQV